MVRLQLRRIKRGLSVMTIAVLLGSSSGGVVLAESCTPPASTGNGVTRPTGAAAGTYSYNCSSNVWENDHFIYNPTTRQTTPKDPVIYTYNASTGQWDTDVWVFNAPSGSYNKRTTSMSEPPAGATRVGGPVVKQESSGSGNGVAGSGASASSKAGSTTTSQSTSGTSVAMANNVSAVAISGNASVTANTTAGNATSGDAKASALVINSLQSNTTLCGDGNTLFFVTDIDGDVNGDILLDPATLQAAAASAATNATYNTTLDAEMNNAINVTAQSGDASVTRNTTAGSATSGTAVAMANVINLINSAITAGSSFTGVININGNLNGDILLPPNFIDQLLASNVPTVQLDAAKLAENNSSAAAMMTNQTVRNNVTANASSGQALVDRNTTAGNAMSGNGTSNVTIFNLTGSNVIGSNSLLVFVNNMGRWVGLLVDAPGSTTAAQYGGGITSNSVASQSSDVSSTTNNRINNDITVNARSGNSTVDSNTTAGNATTGDAKAAVNLLNISESSFTLSNWLGVLFINVFGTWNGSFGVNTSAGDPIASENPGSNPVAGQESTSQTAQVFRFLARQQAVTRKVQSSGAATSIPTTPSDTEGQQNSRVQAAGTTIPNDGGGTQSATASDWSGIVPVVGMSLGLGALLMAAEKFADRRKQRLNSRPTVAVHSFNR